MNNAYLRRGLGLFVFALCFALFSLFPVYYENLGSLKGEPLFPDLELSQIAEIRIHTPKEEITLVKDENLWRVSEADMYFANYQMVEKLLDFFRYSRIHRAVELTDAEFSDNFVNNAAEIVLADTGGKTLGSVIVGRRTYNNKFAYVRFPDNEKIYMVSNAALLPEYVHAWLQQPLLTLNPAEVRDIIVKRSQKDLIIGRDVPGYPFWIMDGNRMLRRADPEDLLNQLQSVTFTDVRSAQNFDEQLFTQHRELRVVTFDGLIVDLLLFKKDKEYWLKQKLSATSLPTSVVNAYIKNNEALSNYWYFRLSSYAGSRLWNAEISG